MNIIITSLTTNIIYIYIYRLISSIESLYELSTYLLLNHAI